MRPNDRILAVDDNLDNLLILEELLGDEFTIKCVDSGDEALRLAPCFMPDLVLLDVIMPGLDGQETCRLLRAKPELKDAKIVMLSGRADVDDRLAAYELGAVDYITKPFDHQEVLAKVRAWVQMAHKQQFAEIWHELERARDGIGLSLSALMAFRDAETADHLFRMRRYSLLLAEQLAVSGPYCAQIDETFLHHLYRASPLHDIGKAAISDAILHKPGPLTKEEFEAIKQHTVIGSDILTRAAASLCQADYIPMAIEVARHHHERFDGHGYPDGLRGEAIPLAARIVSVADVFDALTSERVYKSAISPKEAARTIEFGAGTQFDPVVVVALRSRFDEVQQAQARINDHRQSRWYEEGP